ncbi:MAG: hypothetical protein WDZ64_00745 [Parcubacteria group bacterium]
MPPEKNPQPTPENPPQNSSLKQIRTFQGDVAEALGTQKESIFSIQQREQSKRAGSVPTTSPKEEAPRRYRQLFLLFIGSLVFIALGALGAWYSYQEFQRKTAPPEIAAPLNRFITPNTEVDLDITGSNRSSLLTSIDTTRVSVPGGELRHLILLETIGVESNLVSTEDFLEILGSRAPGNLVRAFSPLFMFGFLGESTFIIIPLESFENAFAGMLAWEESMVEDIGPLFSVNPFTRDPTATSTQPVFKDAIIQNKNFRIIRREDESTLLYSFFNNRMLIITDSAETLMSIIERADREQLSR